MTKQYKPPYVKKVLMTKDKLDEVISKAALWVEKKFKNTKEPPIFVCILKGAMPFYTRLISKIKLELIEDFIVARSYCGTLKSNGKPEVVLGLSSNIKNRDVIVVEDVVDSARTLSSICKVLKQMKPKSLSVMVLVNKPNKRKVDFEPTYSCIKFYNDPFLIGFGFDIKEKARNLPYLADFDKRYIDKI